MVPHPAGVHVVIDPVGGALFGEALRSVAWGAQVVVIGFAAGGIPKVRHEPAESLLLSGAPVHLPSYISIKIHAHALCGTLTQSRCCFSRRCQHQISCTDPKFCTHLLLPDPSKPVIGEEHDSTRLVLGKLPGAPTVCEYPALKITGMSHDGLPNTPLLSASRVLLVQARPAWSMKWQASSIELWLRGSQRKPFPPNF